MQLPAQKGLSMRLNDFGGLMEQAVREQDMAYPAAVFIGYVGIDRLSIAVCRRLGID